MFAVMTRKLMPTRTVVQDLLSITPYFMSMGLMSLGEQLQLFGSNTARCSFLSTRFLPVFLEESFDEWQCDMICATLMHECGVCCPIDTSDGPGDEARFERRELIYKSEAITCLYHPLNVRGRPRRICQAEWDSYVGEHFYQSRVS